MTKAALYARVSTDAQQKEGTIESQLVELKKQITAAGHVLAAEYIDDGYTGMLLDRPALNRMRADVKTDRFDRIYFLAADRIAREVEYQRIIFGELLKHGKQITINGKDYEQNPENKLTLTMLGAFAEFERTKIIERTSRGRLHRLRMGEMSIARHEYPNDPPGAHRQRAASPSGQVRTSRYPFIFASGFATSRAQSMKSCTTGVSVRFFNNMIPTGQGGIGRVTGSTWRCGRFAPNRSSEAGTVPKNGPLGR
jgi:DNA invertase Pin-like site-specific DNA recombinase